MIEAAAKKIIYGLVREEYIVNGTQRVSYGIAAYGNVDELGSTNVLASIHDLTSDVNAIASMVERCNRCSVSLTHLYDVIEDILL